MKILILSASYPPILGGLQVVVHELAKNFQRQGHDVRVLTNRYPRSLPAQDQIDGVQVSRLLFLTPEIQNLLDGRLKLFAASLYYFPAVQLALHQFVRNFQPDVINLHFPDAMIPFVLMLRKEFSFRLVVSLHGDEVLRWFDEHGMMTLDTNHKDARYGRLQLILEQADTVTACSQALLNSAIQILPGIASKCKVLQNGVDFYRFMDKSAYTHPRPYIFAYGRLVYSKGFDLLLDAFIHFSSHHSDIDLIVAGEGEQLLELEALSIEEGIHKRVLFFGRARQHEVTRLLNSCLFAVIPSRKETFGIAALEALVAGKPILATRVGGMAELLAQYPEYSRLVEPNASALADGLEEMLKALPSFAGLPPLSLGQYSWENVTKLYEKIFCS